MPCSTARFRVNKKLVANKGIVPQYYVENSHEAIIQSGESTAESMRFPTLFTALTAETFTAGPSGGFAENRSRSGAASAGSRKEKQMWTAHHGLSTRRICTRRS